MAEDEKVNSTKELMAFLSTEENPVKAGEFMEFWKTLTDEEKEYYRKADLS